MGRRCIACGHERPNERFGGKGLRRVVCDRCRKLPKQELFDRLGTNECWDFLSQKNISEKNILRLKELETQGGEQLKKLAGVVREIALVCPRPKKRWGKLRHQHPDLYRRAVELELCVDYRSSEYSSEYICEYIWDDIGDDDWPFDTWIYPSDHAAEEEEDIF